MKCGYRGHEFRHKAAARWGVLLDLLGIAWTYSEATRRYSLPALGIDLLPWFGAVSPCRENPAQLARPLAIVGHVGNADPQLLALHPSHPDTTVYVTLGVDGETFMKAAALASKALRTGWRRRIPHLGALQ